ncbi:alpha/beta fold hydrolase [Advenella mimigardefordensis]|uniref:Alpha/beta hydrolase fold domain-containing protein n=1 Tax=Advenella mimigardefordensis (strain DSM 17166 / LMG 22922 / DPN7) TaxID=1247726 RepID=W0PE06_ADVMD|nr:alpha/beta hydrolase [Advenella mimigardefordensis]AHG65114.1 alpha/beta hydrolase fold domain-containing protein [Advenella mimigardefordensis DPN7]
MDTLIHGCGPINIIAIHGIQGTNRVWLPLASQLADQCTFIVPNLPGRGARKDCSERDMTLESFTNVIEDTVHKYINDGQSYCLAGWSMGVSVALAFVSQAQNKQPDKLMLLSGVPDISQVSWFTQTTESDLLDEIRKREQRLKLQDAASHHAVMWTWRDIASRSLREQCKSVDVPCLIMSGTQDKDSPLPLVTQFCDLLAKPTFLTIENAGHSILTENTAAVSAAFTDFLNLE